MIPPDPGKSGLFVGVDLTEVHRISQSVERHGDRFLGRVFTDGERAYCSGQPSKLAARFAAKEAVAKLLGTGIGPVGWRDIEVVSSPSGCPEVLLHGAAADRARDLGIDRIALSISHTRDLAIAVAVAS